jgi:hypothetical protein
MEQHPGDATQSVTIPSFDGDCTIQEGDRIRLWKHMGPGFAHEAYLGVGGILYDNSGPGESVRRANARDVLSQYKIIEIISRSTPLELRQRIALGEAKLGTP